MFCHFKTRVFQLNNGSVANADTPPIKFHVTKPAAIAEKNTSDSNLVTNQNVYQQEKPSMSYMSETNQSAMQNSYENEQAVEKLDPSCSIG